MSAFLLVPLAWTALFQGSARAPDPVPRLLEGVSELAHPGVPGPVSVFGPRAFAVAGGEVGDGVLAVVAGSRALGRVLVFGHDGFFTRQALGFGDTGRLVRNGLEWLAGGRSRAAILVRGLPELASWMKEQGFDARTGTGPLYARDLRGVRVLALTLASLSDAELPVVRAFLKRGGGLLTAGLGWGWLQLHPGKDLRRDHPGNRLLAPLGLALTDGTFGAMLPRAFLPGRDGAAPLVHAGRILALLEKRKGPLDAATASAWSRVLIPTLRSLPPGDRLLLPRLKRLLANRKVRAFPTEKEPFRETDLLERLGLLMRHLAALDADPARRPAFPGAFAFPGPVPKNAPRLERRVDLDLEVPGWHGTGLYAPPGEPIETVLELRASALGLALRIGCHTDRLWQLPVWKRHPEISASLALSQADAFFSNPHGGLIYLEVPPGLSGHTAVTLRGGVAAPRFVLGRTDPAKWRRRIRLLPGPWAELETAKVVLTVPSEVVRELADPAALLRFWNDVLDCYSELDGRPLPKRPERLVADLQISAGYMHAGYPIMTGLDAAPVMVDREVLRGLGHGGVWGLWHEIGHNHQRAEWTFAGTGEVTNNLFTLYVLDRISGIPPAKTEQIRGQAEAVRAHLAAGAPFEEWKRHPFLALAMYAQVQEAFGWEPFRRVFADYNALPASERPRTDDEKRDQWLVRLSRAVGRDLGPFFELWGVPASAAARTSLSDLDAWVP
ncbi:MAG: M60 family metallopeptidase [Planctomycetota bacterium]